MNKKILIPAVIVIILIAAAFALVNERHPSDTGPIKVGLAVALSGPETLAGYNELNGAQMAAAELNAAGGVLGRPIQIVPMDSKSTPEGRVDAATALAKAGAPFMLSPWDEGNAALADIATKGKIATMLIAGGEIGAAARSPYVFRVWPSDAIAVHTMVDYAAERHMASVAVIADAEPSAQADAAAFARYASTTAVRALPPVSTDAAGTAAASKPDAYFIATGSTETLAAAVKAIRATGTAAPILYPSDITYSNLKDKLTAAELRGFIYPIYQPPTPGFQAAYAAAYKAAPGIYADTSYDAVYLFADAMKAASSTDPAAVIASFASRDGASGRIQFNADGERTQMNVALLTFDGTSKDPRGI